MRQTARQPRGVAMLLVLSVLALVAVLGTALLSASSIQVSAAQTTVVSSQAQAMADSGISLAAYNLQYPMKARGFSGLNWWQGDSAVSLGTAVPGNLNVSVTRVSAGLFDVTSSATVTTTSGTAVQRTFKARLQASTGSLVAYAVGFNDHITLPSSVIINGNVQANKKITTSGQVTGNVYYGISAGTSGAGQITGQRIQLDEGNTWPVPSWTQVKDYRTSYVYAGQTYYPTRITASTLGVGTVLGPTTSNPAGIYVRTGALTVSHFVTINGTLIMDTGPLYVAGGYSTITAASGFPALVMKGDMYLQGSGSVRDLTINGVSWLGGTIRSTGSVATGFLKFNGSLMVDSGSVDSAFGGKVYINYSPQQPVAPELDTTQAPMGVKVVWWKQ